MRIELHIERLILDGLPLEIRHGPLVRAAVEKELTRLIAAHGLGHEWQSGGAVPSDAGGDQYILSHLALPMPECRDNKEGTRWFHRR